MTEMKVELALTSNGLHDIVYFLYSEHVVSIYNNINYKNIIIIQICSTI